MDTPPKTGRRVALALGPSEGLEAIVVEPGRYALSVVIDVDVPGSGFERVLIHVEDLEDCSEEGGHE